MLTVGLTQLGWTFETNAAAPQTSNLIIDNAGSGSIDWSASSDVPWMTLDVVTGTALSTIIVSANSLSQTITIPAGIVVGSLFEKPIAVHFKIVLPLIRQ